MSGPQENTSPAPPPPLPPARRFPPGRVAGKLLRVLLVLAMLLLVALGVSWMLLHRAEVTPRIVPLLPGVKVIGADGPLLGDFKADRIEIALPRGGHIIIQQPSWKGLEIWPDGGVRWHLKIKADALSATRVEIVWVSGPPAPSSGPLSDLDLPLSVNIGRVRVAEAYSRYWGKAPLTNVDGSLALQVPKGLFGREHRVKLGGVAWRGWRASGQVSTGTRGKMPIDAAVAVRGAPLPPEAAASGVDAVADVAATAKAAGAIAGKITDTIAGKAEKPGELQAVRKAVDEATKDAPAKAAAEVAAKAAPNAAEPRPEVQADMQIKGPLARLAVTGKLGLWLAQADGSERSQGRLDVDGEVAPMAAWPLTRLKALATDLNLASLHAGLPSTRLSGDVLIEPTAVNDLQAKLNLRNALAGAWDMARLPVKTLQGRIDLLNARKAATVEETLKDGMLDVSAQLPTVGPAALKEPGILSLKGGWGGARTVRLDWRGLTPRALHAAAPPLQLQGSLLLKPQWREGLSQLAQTDIEVSGKAQGLYGQAFAAQDPVRPGRGQGSREGAGIPTVSVPAAMTLSGRYGPGRALVRQLKLQAQEAQAEVRDSQVTWGGPIPWQVKANVAVQAFDPKVWLPWPTAVTGANRLSGKVVADVNAEWRGQVLADIAPSTLGGIPLQGKASWVSPAKLQQMVLSVDADAGGNTVAAKADLPWRRDAEGHVRWSEAASWDGRIHAPALHNLQAIAPLLGAARIAGTVEGDGNAKGLWPKLSTQGRLRVDRFQWDTAGGQAIRLENAKADWQLDTHLLDAPMRAKVEMTKGQMPMGSLEQASLKLEGSLKDHRASLLADFTAQVPKQPKPMPIHVELSAHGGVARDAETAAITAWQGEVGQLLLRKGGLTPRVLLHTQSFKVQAGFAGESRSVVVSPVAVNLMGVGMEVRRLTWRTPSTIEDPVGDLHADLQLTPLNLSTILASWQPQAGWGGDLQLGGKIALHHTRAEPWKVDAELLRQSGDLTLSEPTIEGNIVQRLGIRQARLVVQARQGVWTAAEQFDGRLFGVLSGRQTVTAADPHRLPSPTDPLGGDLDVQIRNLRPWGAWLPAGWRLSGQMKAQAKLAGTLGTPQYTGSVEGEGLGIGQALLGVNITDGILKMKLEGERLELTRFEARSGVQGGSITASGEALLKASPELRLSIKADRFGLLQRVDRRVVVSGEANGVAGAEEIKVDGRVTVDEGLIDISRADAPTVGEDVYVVNRPGDEEEEEDEQSGASGAATQRTMNASIDVDLGEKLKLRGRGLEAFLKGRLKVTTPANKPSIRGTIRVENGTYAAYGQKLVIEHGSVTFTGAIENPRLDILAMRAQSPTAAETDVKVGVNITGTALDPRVRLYSDPAMSETEKLSWLVLGRAPTGLGGADIGLLQSAAVALLSGEGKPTSDTLVSKLGLDELSVRQTDGAVRETIVNLGKQVSKKWYVGYERSLNETSGNWQLIYRVAQRFTVRVQAGDDNALDLIRSWRWD